MRGFAKPTFHICWNSVDLEVHAASPSTLACCFLVVQISLLKFVLVRCCLDVVSLSRVLQSTVIFGTDVVSFGTRNVSFGRLVEFNLAPLGTIERSRTWEHKKGDLGVQAWISIDLG